MATRGMLQEAPKGVTIAPAMSPWIKLIMYGVGALGGGILIALLVGLARNLTLGHRMLLGFLVGLEVWALTGPLRPAVRTIRDTFGMDAKDEAAFVFGGAVVLAVVVPTIAVYGVLVAKHKPAAR